MSMFNFVWDLHQSGQIEEMEKRIEDLERDLKIAREWIEYLNNELKKVKNEPHDL